MSHTYPLATDAAAALRSPDKAARTRADAETLAAGREVVALETEWLAVAADEAEALMAVADESAGQGFVQRYEDASGAPVLAVTYWKLAAVSPVKAAKAKTKKAPPSTSNTPTPAPVAEDHTDDLYFRQGRTKPKKAKPPKADPNQLDLF